MKRRDLLITYANQLRGRPDLDLVAEALEYVANEGNGEAVRTLLEFFVDVGKDITKMRGY